MKARRWVLFIGLNIIISALTTVAVLSFKGELERIVIVTAAPGATSRAGAATQAPSGQPTEPTVSPTAPKSVEYIIQAGDTLGGIALAQDVPLEDLLKANNLAEGDIIQPGQVLAIPFGEIVTPTPVTPSPVPVSPMPATATSFPTETPTPPGPVQVRIQELLAPGRLDREGVVIVNRGRTVNLQNWTLGAADGTEVYTFPRLTLAQEVPVTVYTVAGNDSPQELHWGQSEAQWGQRDTIIELRDADGDLIATYTVP